MTKLLLIPIALLSLPAFSQQVRQHGKAYPAVTANATAASTSRWHPALETEWQWQLSTPVNQSVKATMYDIDMFDNSASTVASLHSAGRKVVCYIDFGTWENSALRRITISRLGERQKQRLAWGKVA